jgi:propionyl-CoA synthetase
MRCAALLRGLGVGKGDVVLIYMPMIPEAIFAMLASVRVGAVHSVVFGGFAPASLALRIDDARPKVMITSDAGMRAGRVIPYKHLVDEAMRLSDFPPEKVVIVNRGLDKNMAITDGRDLDYAALAERHADEVVPVTWLESSDPSYVMYTSGTTGKPKGVQRDTGGYAVALAASMKHIYCGKAGETMFTTSDIGWVVGHSYIVYAPLLCGLTTIVYEGVPIRPDPGIWWKIVQDYKVKVMFSSPTGVRVLKKTGSRIHVEVRYVVPEAYLSCRRTARRTNPHLADRGTGQAGDRPLLANRNRVADTDIGAGCGGNADQVRQPVFPGLWLRSQIVARVGCQ